MRSGNIQNVQRLAVSFTVFALLGLAAAAKEAAAQTVTPNTWNIIGLDSNRPADGPNRFPVGAKVCGLVSGATGTATLVWEAGGTDNGTYIYLRAGSANPVAYTVGPDGCADAYFEVEVARNAAAFNKTRRYYITSGGGSTPRPRELFVEKLVSQSRNFITSVKLNGAFIPAGGAMNLLVGNTYTIELAGGTAPSGYEQFEKFINFPNTIFQVLSVNTTYSASPLSSYVSNPNPALYADGCRWENDPNSPYYLSCLAGGKAGGSSVVTTYTVKILGGAGTSQTLNTLLYDFSGSSFHYNADFSSGARIANIIDPANITIAKNFTPNPTNVNGVSTLTFTLANPNGGAVGGLNFTDDLPASSGNQMVVASPANATTNGCGAPVFAPIAGTSSLAFSNGTIAANSSCTIKVNVTAPAAGTYDNTSNPLYVDLLNTGKTASASLTVNTSPPPPPPVCGIELAKWTFPTGFSTTAPLPSTALVSAAASAGAGIVPTNSTTTSTADGTGSWISNGGIGNAATLDTTTNDYFEFAVNTTGYSSAYLNFNAQRKTNNSPKGIAVYSGTAPGNPEAGTSLYNNATVIAANTTWYAFGAGNSLPLSAGTGTTYARIYAFNAGNSNPGSDVHIDDVTITACGIISPPRIEKNFSPATVAANGASTLSFVVTNPSGTTATGIRFNDTLVSGLTVTSGSSAQCGGTLTRTAPGTISFANGSLAPSASCNITAQVTAGAAGPYENVSGFIYSSLSGTNTTATGIATATVVAVAPPGIAKRFSQNPILANGVSTLTFVITNPNQNNTVSGVTFSDAFPGTMRVASTPTGTTSGCGSPTFAPAAGAASVSFSGGTIAGGGTCEVKVDITAPAEGTYVNTSGAVSHVINAATVNGNIATDTLTVNPASPKIDLLKQVGLSSSPTGSWGSYLAVPAGTSVYYKLMVENSGDVALTGPTVTDALVSTATCSWPGTLPVAVAANDDHISICVVGPVTAAAGSVLNTATASATYSAASYTDQSQARYASTGLAIAKSATESSFAAAGTVLNYSYVVTNSGSATLAGPVTVADNKTAVSCPALSTIGDNDNYLDPGESVTCTAAYTVTAADVTAKQVTNTASATAGGAASPTVSKTVPLAPDLRAGKVNNAGGSVPAGGSFVWTLTVSNAVSAGTATFAGGQVLLRDDLASSATYSAGTVLISGVTGTGTINCAIASNTLSCSGNGSVVIPATLQGSIAVTNGSPAVTGAGTAFTTQLTAGSVLLINGVPYGVSSITNDATLTLAANYAGATAGGLVLPGSFSVPVTVTTTTAGSLVNPKSGGVCRADPDAVIPEIDETNNDCSDTVTVGGDPPSLTIVKSSQVFSDPVNGTTSPKIFPGSVMLYTILVTNSGSGTVDSGTMVVTDGLPPTMEFFSGDINGPGTGPILFTDGAIASGLTYTFSGLANDADGLGFSNNNGTDYLYHPPAADFDPAVNRIKVTLGGAFNGASGGNNPSFSLKFQMRVK